MSPPTLVSDLIKKAGSYPLILLYGRNEEGRQKALSATMRINLKNNGLSKWICPWGL